MQCTTRRAGHGTSSQQFRTRQLAGSYAGTNLAWVPEFIETFRSASRLQRQMAAEPRVLMTPRATGGLCASVCLVALIAMLATAALAGAKGPVVWSGATQVDSSPITALACPAASLCVGVDGAGNVLSSTNPEGSAESWRVANIDTPNALSGLSCPSLSLCVAVDGAGNAATSTDPAGGRAAWAIDRIDPSINDPNSFSSEPNLLQGVSCPDVSLCVAVDDVGNAISSTTPTAGSEAWQLAHADNGIAYECYHYNETGPDCQPGFLGVSCPSVSLCVGVDWSGNVLSTTAPSEAGTWSGASPYLASDEHLWGVSCPSLDFCATVNGYDGQVTTWSPHRPFAPKTSTSFVDAALFDVWCRSRSLCFTAGASSTQHNVLFASTAPAGGRVSWRITNMDPAGITSLACVSDSVCVAGDSTGHIVIGRTTASVRGQLQRQLEGSIRQAKPCSPRENGGLSRTANDAGCGTPSSLLVSTRPKAPKRACARRDSPPTRGAGRHPDDEVDADPPGTPTACDFRQPSLDRNGGSGCHRRHPCHRAGSLSPSNARVTVARGETRSKSRALGRRRWETSSVRWRLLALGLLGVLAGCAGSSSPRSSDKTSSARAQVSRVISNATVAPTPGPGFKIRAASARRLHGLDLWGAVVDPMIKPLVGLEGRPELHRRLNASQYAVFVLFGVDDDYSDGGMFEVYYNSTGAIAGEAVGLLREVGAPLHAQALSLTNQQTWPTGQVPSSRVARRRELGPPERPLIHVTDAHWMNAEAREGQLESIVERFIRSHRNDFFY